MLLFLQTEEEENWKTKVTVCYRQSWGGQYSARVTEVQMKFLFSFFSDELLLRQCVKGPWTRKAAADPQYRGGPLPCYVPEVDPLLKIRCCTSSSRCHASVVIELNHSHHYYRYYYYYYYYHYYYHD